MNAAETNKGRSGPFNSVGVFHRNLRAIETLMSQRAALTLQRRDIEAHAMSAGHQEIFAICEEMAEELERMKRLLIEWRNELEQVSRHSIV